MPNYNESTVTGTRWTRSNSVRIFNDYQSTPQINFAEEEIVSLGDNEFMKKPKGGIGTPLTPENITTAFQLVHPQTGEPIGESTYQQVYVLLHSLYLHLAAERDENQQMPPSLPTEE